MRGPYSHVTGNRSRYRGTERCSGERCSRDPWPAPRAAAAEALPRLRPAATRPSRAARRRPSGLQAPGTRAEAGRKEAADGWHAEAASRGPGHAAGACRPRHVAHCMSRTACRPRYVVHGVLSTARAGVACMPSHGGRPRASRRTADGHPRAGPILVSVSFHGPAPHGGRPTGTPRATAGAAPPHVRVQLWRSGATARPV